MKTILKSAIQISSVALFFIAAMPVSSSAVNFNFETYTIKAVDQANNSAMTKTWNLQYSETGNKVSIVLNEKNGEKEFVVKGQFVEVSYVLSKKGFGARYVKGSQSEVPAQILNNVMNSEKIAQQRIITVEQIDNETALNLIAGFLPDLLNENYKYLLQ